jgi:hypothetical protein
MKTRLIIICLLSSATLAWGQSGFNARSMGMAGAYQSMARGAEVSYWNPANLGLSDNPSFSLDLLNVGLNVGNNTVDLNFYNSFFTQDADQWTDADKADILSAIPSDGVREFNRVQATALGTSIKQYALAINGFAYSDLRVPKEFIALPLEGLGPDTMRFSNVEGEAVVGTEIALSGGHAFDLGLDFVQEFSAGITLKYLLGQVYAKADYANGWVVSNSNALGLGAAYEATLGGYVADDGTMGSGFGVDLGAAGKINDKLSVGFSLSNIIGSIKFGEVQKEGRSINLTTDGTIDPEQFDNMDEYLDNLTETSNTSYTSSDGATYAMPKMLTMSGNYLVKPWLSVEADFQQGLNKTAGNSTKSRLALGGEMRYIPLLPLRAGLAFGGVQGTTLALGFGLDFKYYKLDLAVANQQGIFASSKGLGVALSNRITF